MMKLLLILGIPFLITKVFWDTGYSNKYCNQYGNYTSVTKVKDAPIHTKEIVQNKGVAAEVEGTVISLKVQILASFEMMVHNIKSFYESKTNTTLLHAGIFDTYKCIDMSNTNNSSIIHKYKILNIERAKL